MTRQYSDTDAFVILGPYGIGQRTTRLYYTVHLVLNGRRTATLAHCKSLKSALAYARRERTIRQLDVPITNGN